MILVLNVGIIINMETDKIKTKEDLLVLLMDFKVTLQDGSVETDSEIKEFVDERY